MSQKLKNCKTFLLCLFDNGIPTAQKKSLLNNITDCQVNVLVETFYNLLQGTISLSPKKLKAVEKYKNLLRKLVEKKKSINFKKQIIKKTKKTIITVLELLKKSLAIYLQ